MKWVNPYVSQRHRMVLEQLVARGVSDQRVLDAMRHVAREAFVPEGMRDVAYADRPLPIGEGQTISQPYIVAAMTQALGLEGDENVLEIGTGSGYAAAVLAHVAGAVHTIERIPSLARRARGAGEVEIPTSGPFVVSVYVKGAPRGRPAARDHFFADAAALPAEPVPLA